MLEARQAKGGEQPVQVALAIDSGMATLNGSNEPKNRQQTAASQPDNSTAGSHRHLTRFHPVGGSRERLTNEQPANGDRINRQLIGANERNDANESEEEPDERRHFIEANEKSKEEERIATKKNEPIRKEKRRAQLAKQESISERGPGGHPTKSEPHCCSIMLQFVRAKKCLTIPIIILVIYIAAIYCLPFIKIDPDIPNELPIIPFDFHEGPLRPSSASAFKFKHLFKDQIHGPESLAFDSQGNLYMAIEAGFILYAHLNKSSPMKHAYIEQMTFGQHQQQLRRQPQSPELIKIAELNGLRQAAGFRSRGHRADETSGTWKRECQLDEKVYGFNLSETDYTKGFKSNVRVSRCSKPLGIRLSADESQLYVIDTLTGLYRVDLRSDKPRGGQRQVTKLVDFKANNGYQELPAVQLDDEPQADSSSQQLIQPATRLMNVTMKALDDLVIDRTSENHDLIYMTVASQTWPATSFVYDALEGRPSGLVLRYDTASNQLVVLEPNRVAHVRTSTLRFDSEDWFNKSMFEGRSHQPSFLLGAPQLDENDVFDDRPLNFPNGLELTDDRQALLIADTSNKRIVRHYIRGPRRGTSDLWAWTPMFPDNIRRGHDINQETYWVVGCGRAPATSVTGDGRWPSSAAASESRDLFAMLRTWPRVRKFLMKNIYFIGYLVEFLGENLLNSNRIQDAGYGLRTGSSLCSSGCLGMMIIQYNRYGDVIRSIHSREFPNDLYYYSQVNEVIDSENQEHSLYLGSPSYSYLTKLTLPTESQVWNSNQRAQASVGG